MRKTLLMLLLFTIQYFGQSYMNIKYNDLTYKYAIMNDISEITFNAGGTDMTVTFTNASSNIDQLSNIAEMTLDNSILGGGNPLPVELVSFTAMLNENPQRITLLWTTATEVNNYGFEVERATSSTTPRQDGWEEIGFVEGHGNSNSPKEYTFVDEESLSGTIQYRLKQIDVDGAFKYSDVVNVSANLPDKFELMQNYPNPFNPTTKISYSLPKKSNVTLKVYNTLGQEVVSLVNKQQTAGRYTVEFNPSDYGLRLASGIYIYRLTSGAFVSNKKLLFMK